MSDCAYNIGMPIPPQIRDQKYISLATFRKNGTAVSGRSIMGLMMLAAASGTVIEISATGRDAATAVETLARLIECKFDEA